MSFSVLDFAALSVRRTVQLVAPAAASMAVLVLSVSLPTAKAGTVVIDSFTAAQSPNPATGSDNSPSGFTPLVSPPASAPDGSVYDHREMLIEKQQNGGTSRAAATFSGTFSTTTGDGGSLLWSSAKAAIGSGTPYNFLSVQQHLTYQNSNLAGYDWTSFGNNTLRISKSAGSLTTSIVRDPNTQIYLLVASAAGASEHPLTIAEWFSDTTLEIPYTAFSGDVDFTDIEFFSINSDWDLSSPDFTTAQRRGSVNASVTLTEIALISTATVPEIDPAGIGSVLALVTGGLALLERRRLKVA